MFNTISFVILAVLLRNTLAISDEQRAQIQLKFLAVGAECVKEHNITIDDLASFKDKVFPDSDNAACFAACVFSNVGLFDEKGELSHITALEKAKKVFEDDEELKSIEGLLTTCAKVNEEEVADGEKGCERARLAFECFVNSSEQFGFGIDF